jgi:serine/threonine protein kinase/tetratricopeptide (TPR) repeat protein
MFRWLRKPAAPPGDPDTIQHYRLTRKLGEGGMGVVFEARDARLDRMVAIKRLGPLARDPTSRERLLREARLAAGVSHPNICQVYELGEDGGELYIVMELLSGETLATRIGRGPLPLVEALQVTLEILSGLEAIHARGVVHRDLKPSNVFLTPHGVKLLDFGVARPPATGNGDPGLTTPGTIIGTPHYLPPEALGNDPVGPASDIFALGVILFEMLTGKHAFPGASVIEVAFAVMHVQPPALVGGADVMAADRLIQRALAKRSEERYPDAPTMAREVRQALTLIDTGPVQRVRTMTRLVVLPFRLLRPDPEIDFLAHSLPEAITASLAGLESLTVRSSTAAERFAGDRPDLRAIAAEAGVDAVLLGTLLRAGGEVRVSVQLVEAPSGTVVSTRTAQVGLTDIFQLQDELTRQIVDALAIPLSAHDEHCLACGDAPVNPEAYELYLRANHIGASASVPSRLVTARDLYRRCLELDPRFAPAWARLGRVHRVMAKYGLGTGEDDLARAEEAFRQALELNPELPLAHNLYTYFEIEELHGARPAMLRLLRVAEVHPADPDVFAGLVVACRFCGLLEASIAADRRARRIDPGVQTSVAYTHWMLGDYERAALTDLEEIQTMRHASLWMLGRHAEALEGLRRLAAHWPGSNDASFVGGLVAAMEGDRERCVAASRQVLHGGFHDPEGLLFCARNLAHVGEREFALELIGGVVEGGFHCPPGLVRDPWFDPVRAEPEFVRGLRSVEEAHVESARAFADAGGERVLGGPKVAR